MLWWDLQPDDEAAEKAGGNTEAENLWNDGVPSRCYHPKPCSFCGGDDDGTAPKTGTTRRRDLSIDPETAKKKKKNYF